MATTTIRVETETRDRLNELAGRRRVSAGQIVDELVRAADDRMLLEAAAQDWDRMGADADALATYRAEAEELSAFDSGLPDE
jgi:predicted transcriptional regulator